MYADRRLPVLTFKADQIIEHKYRSAVGPRGGARVSHARVRARTVAVAVASYLVLLW